MEEIKSDMIDLLEDYSDRLNQCTSMRNEGYKLDLWTAVD